MLKFLKRKKINELLRKYPEVVMIEVSYHDLTSRHFIEKINCVPAPEDLLGSQSCSSLAYLAFEPNEDYKRFLIEANLTSDCFLDFILELKEILGYFSCSGIYHQDSFSLEEETL